MRHAHDGLHRAAAPGLSYGVHRQVQRVCAHGVDGAGEPAAVPEHEGDGGPVARYGGQRLAQHAAASDLPALLDAGPGPLAGRDGRQRDERLPAGRLRDQHPVRPDVHDPAGSRAPRRAAAGAGRRPATRRARRRSARETWRRSARVRSETSAARAAASAAAARGLHVGEERLPAAVLRPRRRR